MQERNKGLEKPEPQQFHVDQFDALAKNMVRLFDQGAKAFSTLAERSNGQGPYSLASEVGEAAKSLGEIARHWASEPSKFVANIPFIRNEDERCDCLGCVTQLLPLRGDFEIPIRSFRAAVALCCLVLNCRLGETSKQCGGRLVLSALSASEFRLRGDQLA